MKHKSKVVWQNGMNFSATFDDNDKALQISDSEGDGFTPKRLMLAGLVGCTGLDVAGMLKKMRAEPEAMEIEVEANLNEEHPKQYDQAHIIYTFTGKDLNKERIEHAVELSTTKYCGVSAMFEQFLKLTHEIRYK